MLPGSDPQQKKAGLAHWAARVLEECDKASAGFAADPVHDLRVAIRRCRSMADGFLSVDPDPAWKQMKRLAKPLFSSLGELRDTQVMLEWVAKLSPPGDPVGESLSAALAQKETALKTAAQGVLANFRSQALGFTECASGKTYWQDSAGRPGFSASRAGTLDGSASTSPSRAAQSQRSGLSPVENWNQTISLHGGELSYRSGTHSGQKISATCRTLSARSTTWTFCAP